MKQLVAFFHTKDLDFGKKEKNDTLVTINNTRTTGPNFTKFSMGYFATHSRSIQSPVTQLKPLGAYFTMGQAGTQTASHVYVCGLPLIAHM